MKVMMKCRVINKQWGLICLEFYRMFDMPALPPIGTDIIFDHDDEWYFGCTKVESVMWSNYSPDQFDVELTSCNIDDETSREEAKACLAKTGWFDRVEMATDAYESRLVA